MKKIAPIAVVLALVSVARAQLPQDITTIRSVSGQFFVSARSARLSPRSIELSAEPNFLTLEPTLLVVSCERIKQELWRELDAREQWRGKIFVRLYPARFGNDPVTITPDKFGGSWNYRVEMPDVLDRNRFVEAMVRVLLLEMANRRATDRSAEVPEWLTEGFARQLLGWAELQLILPPPHSMDLRPNTKELNVQRMDVDVTDDPRVFGPNTRRLDPMTEAVAILRARSPLGFEELSWPTEDQLSGDAAKVYRASSQLFVSQLLRLKDGADCLREMVARLPECLNWQLAFLDGFHSHFQTALDVEKWWALQLVQFSGRDLLHLWNATESWKKLDALLYLPIDVQIGEGAPMRTEITYQTMIRGWDRTRQLQTLKQKLWELDLLRLHVAQEIIPLVDDYRAALRDYYTKRSASSKIMRHAGPLPDPVSEEAIQRLDELDVRRTAMRPELQNPMASTANP
jgi:hypothetical protein